MDRVSRNLDKLFDFRDVAKDIDAWITANGRVPAAYVEIEADVFLVSPLDDFVREYLAIAAVGDPPLVKKSKYQMAMARSRPLLNLGVAAADGTTKGAAEQLDFFVLDLVDASFKSDRESMEAPYFALGTNDLKPYEWTSVDGNLEVRIRPPQADDANAKPKSAKDLMPSRTARKSAVPARASIHDKDILIYLASCLIAQLKAGEILPAHNRVQITPYAFFTAVEKPCGKEAYVRLRDALERLARTYVTRRVRDKKTGIWGREQGFSLISSWDAAIDPTDARNSSIQVVLAEPFAEAIKTQSVLQLHKNYFQLRKGLAKALYLVARSKCGNQPDWKIGLDKLRQRVGSRDALRNFRQEILTIITEGEVPDYRLQLTTDDEVIFYNTTGFVSAPPLKIKSFRRPRKKPVDKS
jgi:hypothetical protein